MAPPPSALTIVTPNESAKAPPPSTAEVSPVLSLVMRILAFLCLLVSLILLTTSSFELPSPYYSYGWDRYTFTYFRAFRYLCATIVIGLAYTLLQTAFAIFHLTSGTRIGIDGLDYIDFYGDKVVSYILATGAAASFGMSQELKRLDSNSNGNKFVMATDAATSLCLLAFLFTAISSIFSSFALPKRV